MTWESLISQLLAGQSLDHDSAYWLMDQVMTGDLGEIRLASALTALAVKGPSVPEVHGFADAMRDHAVFVDLPSNTLDIVGTGGDGHNTVNVSTMAAILLATMNVPVVKHGNRASTSASGSADVLEAIGINLDCEPHQLIVAFKEVPITFLFANKMHPAMRYAAPVRRTLAFPTIFNLLGPLTNPARPTAVAIGSANEKNAEIMAGVCASRGVNGMVFRGKNLGLDELSTLDVNQVWLTSGGELTYFEFDPVTDLGLNRGSMEELRGGEAAENAAIAREIFAGRGTQTARDAVALNAAAGLVAYSLVPGVGAEAGDPISRLKDAFNTAQETLASGAANKLLERWIEATNR